MSVSRWVNYVVNNSFNVLPEYTTRQLKCNAEMLNASRSRQSYPIYLLVAILRMGFCIGIGQPYQWNVGN